MRLALVRLLVRVHEPGVDLDRLERVGLCEGGERGGRGH